MKRLPLLALALAVGCNTSSSSSSRDAARARDDAAPARDAPRPGDARDRPADASAPAPDSPRADGPPPTDGPPPPPDAPPPPPDGPAAPAPGPDTTVTAFERVPVHFTGEDNRRTVDAVARFPAEGAYGRILLRLGLDCPNDRCDPWDRFGTIGAIAGDGTVIEVARFMTPYRLAARWEVDVTDLRPLLRGDVTLRVFIDTWVGPGSQYGDGWLFSAAFEMTGGVPARLPVAVTPIWPLGQVPYGDPARPIEATLAPRTLELPPGSAHAVRTFVTGHGQGNADNCAEFCARRHTLDAAGTHTLDLWRDDCETTAVPDQPGTWRYPRAGWCPGAVVHPWVVELAAPAGPVTFGYHVEDYVNTCRPDEPMCRGCTLGTGCAYDGGAHTEPNYQVSSVLVTYR